MKTLSLLNDEVSDIVKQIAETKGLSQLDFEKSYRVYKIGSKSKNGAIEMEEKRRVATGMVELTGNDKCVCLFMRGFKDWFKTSAVMSCSKNSNGYILETENSFYELKEDT
jgi:flavodoxin